MYVAVAPRWQATPGRATKVPICNECYSVCYSPSPLLVILFILKLKMGSRRQLALLILGWISVACSSGLISFALPLIRREWALTGSQTGVMLNSFLVGMLGGASIFGRISDVRGRRQACILSLILLLIGTVSCGVAPNWMLMSILRLVAGIGATGYMVSASTLLIETSPEDVRGRYVAILESGWAYGWLIASYLGLIVAPKYGWRPVFAGGLISLVALAAVYLARESEVYRRAVRTPLSQALKTLLSQRYLKVTIMLWIHWICIVLAYWGIFLWLPNILYERGLTLVKSLKYSFFITLIQIPGYWSGAYFVEKLGRKLSLSLYMLLAGLGSIFYMYSGSEAQIVASAFLISLFNLGAWGITYAYTPELYPARIRGLGAGWANMMGRIGGIVGPFLVGLLLDVTGTYLVAFAMFAGVHFLSSAIIMLLGVETKGARLEE